MPLRAAVLCFLGTILVAAFACRDEIEQWLRGLDNKSEEDDQDRDLFDDYD